MESDIREKITAKRARRAQRKTSISTEQENLAYEDDESQSTPRNKQILTKKHRDKGRELSEQIVEENPVQVENEIDNIRDKIREKLRKNLLTKLEKVKSEETQSEKDDTLKPDTKLDLTSSSMEQASLRQSAAEAFKQKMHKLQQQNAEKNYRLITSSRKDQPGSALDERISEESKKLEREKERKAKNKFRKLGLAVIDEIRLPNSEEQFDFFAKKTWDKAEEEEKPEEPKEAEIKTEDDEKDDKDSAPLIINLEDDWREMSYIKALYVPEDLVREADAKKLFMPLSSKVPFEQKTSAEGIQPRFLDEEGIYVGRKPYVTRKNKNLMENRLLKFPDKIGLKWFEVDGEIVALADPIKYVSTRPSFSDNLPEALWSSYRKAVYLENFARNVVAEKGGLNSINVARYRLDLDINQVQFSFHHLFSAEHVIAYRLKNMYEHFKLSEENNLVEILTQKLIFLSLKFNK
ncbi:coiled-coil and C2 domain-containing 2A isoform X1 [Brachionus plicatilis]|uniref:Coiled-coil and C2 domain-containing 2A isoform X1 n=1 Tax=Brachionus plicatilis TaxID=10195 RepID=A0A3M7PLZ5_BRAPC|nr:coiled-coil and C2 domain-containing 2A isoform X1 [Brachionus plicatilis]